MAAPKRSKIQRERDRLTIAELHLKGWSQQRIADFLELDKSNICRELKKIKAAWKAETIEDHNTYVQQELRRLAMLEAEYWGGWDRSQESKEISLNERLATGKDETGQVLGRIKQATRREQRVGDSAFLNGVLSCVRERAKLLDLYPKEVKPEATEAETQLKDYVTYLASKNGNHSTAHPNQSVRG